MKLRIENLFVLIDNDKKVRVHLDHINAYGKYGAELVFKGISNKKTYPVSRSGMKYAQRIDPSICFFMDERDLKSLKAGDDIFIFFGDKIQAFRFYRWSEDRAIVYREVDKKGVTRHLTINVKPHLLLARPHKFKGNPQYKSKVANCENCTAIKT